MFIYNLVVLLYGLVIRIAALSNPKAKLWVKGRDQWRDSLASSITKLEGGKRIWVHCASLGEFEQGRPLIESIKQKHPQFKIILTFFSPSGYEGAKNYEKADVIAYLPLDTKQNAIDFLNISKPDIAIFIKYEFWVNFLNALRAAQIPSYLVSAVFKDHHPFFKWYGNIFRASLRAFNVLMVQDEHSKELLKGINYTNVAICGDTRFDRVLEIKQKFTSIPELEEFKGTHQLIIAGSTWPNDEELILKAFIELNDPHTKLIIAPHEIDHGSLQATKQKVEQSGLKYCLYSEGVDNNSKVLILNTMGMLSSAYYYANVAFVGGGFNGGIHNILEPCVFNIPVAFYGNNFSKYNEAVELVNLGAVTNVQDAKILCDYWKKVINDSAEKERISKALQGYFYLNANVTSKVMSIIDFG